MNLLQYEALNASPDWHRPFHLAGTGGMSSSLKLGDSGQIPDSDGVIRMNILLFSFFPPFEVHLYDVSHHKAINDEIMEFQGSISISSWHLKEIYMYDWH